MPARILIVDDEPEFEKLMVMLFRRKLRGGEYEFLFAQDGMEALEIIREDPGLDMVLTDINMPRMDGLTLLGEIKKVRPLLKSIVVSAYEDMPNIRRAMNFGAFDFVTKPIEFSDLETTITKTLEEAAVLQEVSKTRELAEKNKLLESLDQLKTKFFTNISHEFRTPLTVISGMTEQIGKNPDRWLQKGLGMIRRNSDNLLDLVQQILHLRKLESGNLELQPVQGDVIPYLRYLSESFQPLAESRDIKLHFQPEISELVMDYDPEKLLRITSNLLGNALKFCSEGDEVFFELHLQDGALQLQVRDTGPGIPPDQLPYIFNRFFQAQGIAASRQQGSGIGLSLVHELVRLMGGTIEVDSQEGQGAKFTLILPIRNEAPLLNPEETPHWTSGKSPFIHPDQPRELEEEQLSDLPTLLIVEDHADIAEYLMSLLEGRYHLLWEKDGQAGIERALEVVPDIIISDVMMPRKDGFDLCQTLKTDIRTSHIPIILLTAKADASSRIAGLKRGADAYLAKPFDRQELEVRLEQLLELREQLQQRYRAIEHIAPTDEDAVQQEDEFVLLIKSTIHEHMDELDFGIHELCRAIGVSRTQLHRKVKALTSRSTSSFIRYIRLLHGKKLLKSSGLNISQVAYDCGFRDPKYFSICFSNEFGIGPKDFRKETRN